MSRGPVVALANWASYRLVLLHLVATRTMTATENEEKAPRSVLFLEITRHVGPKSRVQKCIRTHHYLVTRKTREFRS